MGKCQWFALCMNVATSTLEHPVLGDVSICDRCRDKVRELEGEQLQLQLGGETS